MTEEEDKYLDEAVARAEQSNIQGRLSMDDLTHSGPVQTMREFYKQCERFYLNCTRPSAKEYSIFLRVHIAGFVLLALFGLFVRIAFNVFSFIFRLPHTDKI